MAARPETIWEVPAYLPYLQPDLTPQMVREAEDQIGFKLPTEYLNLLKHQNGGYIRYELPEMCHRMIWGIGPRFPSLTKHEWDEEVRETVSFELDGLVPFDGDGHWYLCLDYRKNRRSRPCVTYADVETNGQHVIASSFTRYLNLLKLELDERVLVISGAADIHRIISIIERALKVRFEHPNAYNHGYPEHRAHCGSSKNGGWIFLSPNEVERGFVREDDDEYVALRHRIVGMAARYRGLPPKSVIAFVSPLLHENVVAACHEAGFEAARISEFPVE